MGTKALSQTCCSLLGFCYWQGTGRAASGDGFWEPEEDGKMWEEED